MYIKNIKIYNFRNIEHCDIYPSKKINIIYGDNAQGKTNLIESIYYSSIFKSFRTNKKYNLIKKDNNNFSIEIIISNNEVDNVLNIKFNKKNEKQILINNKNPNKNIYKSLNTIVYYPDEISLLKNYPSYRRNLIDKSIFFINNEYINIFRKYLKCLKHRNMFLKSTNVKDNSIDDVWKEQLIEYGSIIIKKRIEYIKRINKYFEILSINKVLNETYSIEYENYEIENIKDDLSNQFKKNKDKELKYGYSLAGPHIEDFKFNINNNDINKYSSEGQKRSLLLSYKQSQLLDYKDYNGYYPILLLDDIGTELDNSRKNKIYNKLLDDSGQVFITTIDLPNICFDNTDIYSVENGIFSKFIFD
ncbi:MAG: DNA replication/repair protein RecF [Desulfuromonadales bacterium]|nr:DNA replication/repair protein RecF [Desulfuromonadales bacterium]